jgi:hypothetical protein
MRHFHLYRMRIEVIVDPAGKHRCFHRNRPTLRKGLRWSEGR